MAKTIKIGHASISEDGTKYGTVGDQTSKEVFIKSNYNITKKGYNKLIRPKTLAMAEKMALACEAACKNDYIGYSQSGEEDGRLSLYNEAKKAEINFDLSKINTPCNTDCSAFMSVCAIAGGAKISPKLNTRTMTLKTDALDTFATCGDFNIYEDELYFNSADYLKRGDILIKEGHTLMILANGRKVPKSNIKISTDVIIVNVTIDLFSVEATNVKAKATVTTIKEGKERLATDDILKIYKWQANIEPLKVSDKKSFTVEGSTTGTGEITFDITGLNSATTYCVQATAVSSDTSLESPYVYFTTAQKFLKDNTKIVFDVGRRINEVDKAYLRLENYFKQTIFYNNTRGL